MAGMIVADRTWTRCLGSFRVGSGRAVGLTCVMAILQQLYPAVFRSLLPEIRSGIRQFDFLLRTLLHFDLVDRAFRRIWHFSETHWTLPDIASVSEKFDHEYNQDEYEEKITRLIKGAAIHDHQQSAGQYDLWWDATRLLKKEDHYILVMIDRAGLRPHRRSQGSKEQPECTEHRIFSGSLLASFLVVFLLCFLWLHFIGPRRLVGNWETHEPLSSLSSAIVSALIALTLTAFVLRRVG